MTSCWRDKDIFVSYKFHTDWKFCDDRGRLRFLIFETEIGNYISNKHLWWDWRRHLDPQNRNIKIDKWSKDLFVGPGKITNKAFKNVENFIGNYKELSQIHTAYKFMEFKISLKISFLHSCFFLENLGAKVIIMVKGFARTLPQWKNNTEMGSIEHRLYK